MAVKSTLTGEFIAVKGVQLSAVAAGIKNDGLFDLVLMSFSEGSTTAGVFTHNAFSAAPVQICRERLAKVMPRAFIINSGNANCATGEDGRDDAIAVCAECAAVLGVSSEQVLPFSTGVIGERLPLAKLLGQQAALSEHLSSQSWLTAAQGIMTTDTRPKLLSTQIDINGSQVTLNGICKGAGMIKPDMATLLVFLATDAAIEPDLLEEALQDSVNKSFNRISIDSDTSTNDSCMLTATHQSGVNVSKADSSFALFRDGLGKFCQQLACEIVRDAEGASKFVEVVVEGGIDTDECLAVAYSVADSPLVKTAVFASDANWGRIVMAIGKSGLQNLDANLIDVFLGDTCIVRKGCRDAQYIEPHGATEMAKEEIRIRIVLGRGDETETVWTSDLSHDYIRINAEYRT